MRELVVGATGEIGRAVVAALRERGDEVSEASFGRAAALEMPRGIRINVVSPPWLGETLSARGMSGVPGLPAATVAKTCLEAVHGAMHGEVLES